MRWHTLQSFRAEAAREWTTWAGAAVVIASGAAVMMADSRELTEWAARIGIVGPLAGGALMWLRQQRRRR